MTNADYYVNVYADGSLGFAWHDKFKAERNRASRQPVIGVWHVRLKKGKG